MNDTLVELIAALGGEDYLRRVVAVGVLVAARIAPVCFIVPWLTVRAAPTLLRTAVVLALVMAVTPLALSGAALGMPVRTGLLAVAFVREALIGTTFGVALSLPFYALDWAGRLIDTWRGASLSEVIAPPTGERTSPIGSLYLLAAIAIFVSLGGHVAALDAFFVGLVRTPVGSGVSGDPALASVALGTARLVGDALAFAFLVAAPAGVALVVTEIGFGLLGRTAPQIPLFFAAMPVRAAMGIAAVLFGLLIVVDLLPSVFSEAIRASRNILDAFGT